MSDSDRRNPILPFDPAPLSKWLDGRQIASHRLLSGGKSSTNYLVETSADERFVYRLRKANDCRREAAVMAMARKLVPVPKVLAHDRGWCLMEFVEGEPLLDSIRHVAQAATLIPKLASLQFERPGWFDEGGEVGDFPFTFDDEGLHDAMLDEPQVRQWLGEDLAQEVRLLLDRERERMPRLSAKPCLVHADFNPSNILVREGKVVALLDWEFSHSGTSWMDIGNLRRNTPDHFRPQIAEGLRSGGFELPEDWELRAELIDLGSHLEFLITQRSDAFKRTRVDKVRKMLEFFER